MEGLAIENIPEALAILQGLDYDIIAEALAVLQKLDTKAAAAESQGRIARGWAALGGHEAEVRACNERVERFFEESRKIGAQAFQIERLRQLVGR